MKGKHKKFKTTIGTKKSIAKLCFLICKLVGLEKEGLSFVSVKAGTKLKTKIVLWTIFTTRPEGELPPSVLICTPTKLGVYFFIKKNVKFCKKYLQKFVLYDIKRRREENFYYG